MNMKSVNIPDIKSVNELFEADNNIAIAEVTKRVAKALDELEAIMQKLAEIGDNTKDVTAETRVTAKLTHTLLEQVVYDLKEVL